MMLDQPKISLLLLQTVKCIFNFYGSLLQGFFLYTHPKIIYDITIVRISSSSSSNYYYYFYSLEFFTSALADGFSLESEWQQVSLSLQESSQDSGSSQQCCRLDILYPSANF